MGELPLVVLYAWVYNPKQHTTKDNPMLNFNDDNLWTPVTDYEGLYWITKTGQVRNCRKVMKTYRINSGYLCIDLTKHGLKRKFLLHRLVASVFMPNPENHPEINHKDENKDNNCVDNLEWCTRSHNKQHSMATGTYDAIYTTKNSLGKKHLPRSVSKYHNVGWDKSRCKWTACIRSNGKNYERRRFDTEIEAALHVNHLIDKYGFTDRPKNIIK